MKTLKNKISNKNLDFILFMGHELKTPITSIKVFTQLLYQYFEELKDMKALKYLSRMEGQINSLTHLVNYLLDVTKIQAGKLELIKEEFNFEEMIKEIIENNKTLSKSLRVIKKGSAYVMVFADRYRINQVVSNLISNAFKYSSQSSKVIVTLSASKKIIKVSINGFGDFNPKQSSSSKQKGGLEFDFYLSAEIVKFHGGRI